MDEGNERDANKRQRFVSRRDGSSSSSSSSSSQRAGRASSRSGNTGRGQDRRNQRDAQDTRSTQQKGNSASNSANQDADELDAGWETGTWDTGWATDYTPSVSAPARPSADWNAGAGAGNTLWTPGRRDANEDALTQTLNNTLARLGNVGEPLTRLARVRLLLRRRPAAAALLAFFLLGFLLTCCAPLLPVLRLGSDTLDAYQRAQNLQALFADGTSSLLNTAKLQEAQQQMDGLSHDLYEINSLVNVAGAPLSAISPQVRDLRLLARIGFDLSSSGDEGLQVARTILTPLQGGALAADDTTPGLTQADIAQAQQVLADASSRVQDALAAYNQLDRNALPGPLRPGTKLGNYLQLLPIMPQVLGELTTLMNSVPALLGIGQPAYYLVLAMDRSELRPIGGFTGNYGILTLVGGKQSAQYPLSLSNVYTLDGQYFQTSITKADKAVDCYGRGVQPPEYYWWWPYRNLGCKYGWGLRDIGLSPSFPLNAQSAMAIVEQTPGQLPPTPGAQLQGVIAFTPILIEKLMQITGPISLPQWTSDLVTPTNLEYLIHKFQLLQTPKDQDRKAFTHDLSAVMLAKIKSMHGEQLKRVIDVATQALKSKDLQVYFRDPHAELILQQLGLSGAIRTGSGDGFYVVDTNDGGDKANTFVSEQQTDVVTLLPNGGAIHHLRIAVTYNRHGLVFGNGVDDYNDMQRVYLPGDATILGYSGFNPPAYSGVGVTCSTFVSTIATDCASDNGIHAFTTPTTASDVPGRTMVMGALTVNCGASASLLATNTPDDSYACGNTPQSQTRTVYIEWYTPHAFTMDANGHGAYSEVVEKEPGSADFLLNAGNYLTVYVDMSQLHSSHPNTNTIIVPAPVFDHSSESFVDSGVFQQIIGNLQPISGFDNARLDSDMTVSVSF